MFFLNIYTKIAVILLLTLNLSAQTLEEFKAQQQKEFNKYKQKQQDGFKKYKEEQLKAFSEYKNEINKYWDVPKTSTKKRWVSYTKDKKTRSIVDFSKDSIVIQTIAKSKKDALKKLKDKLANVITIDTKTLHENDPLDQKLKKIKKPAGVVDADIKAEPILSSVIFNKPPTKKTIHHYVDTHLNTKQISTEKSKKIKNQKVYTAFIQMPKNTMIKRSYLYYKEVKKQSQKQQIPLELLFAIMHSESSFNPRARSYIPAYGLMQIVPKTAGIDAYEYLYHKRRLLTSSYLYDSTNNITMGSAYLHILYYRYLRKIKNPQSRLYCTIAAYNTGAGNIAYAFTKHYNISKAASIINSMTPNEVYETLLRDLRWDEPKKYLKTVHARMIAYKKVYGNKIN